MVGRSLFVFASLLVACSSDDSPVKKQPPSLVSRIAAQACACTTVDCVTPLRSRLEGIANAQHADGNAQAENAEALAKVNACAAKLGAK